MVYRAFLSRIDPTWKIYPPSISSYYVDCKYKGRRPEEGISLLYAKRAGTPGDYKVEIVHEILGGLFNWTVFEWSPAISTIMPPSCCWTAAAITGESPLI